MFFFESIAVLREQEPDQRAAGKAGKMLAKGGLAAEQADDRVQRKDNQQGDRYTGKQEGAVFDREDHEHGDKAVDARGRAFSLVEMINEGHEKPRYERRNQIAEQRFNRTDLRFHGVTDDQERRGVCQDMQRPHVEQGERDQPPDLALSDFLVRQMKGAVQTPLVVPGQQLLFPRNRNAFGNQEKVSRIQTAIITAQKDMVNTCILAYLKK